MMHRGYRPQRSPLLSGESPSDIPVGGILCGLGNQSGEKATTAPCRQKTAIMEGLALCFDIHVQDGRINDSAMQQIQQNTNPVVP
jgi:hypothetical protein